MVTYGNLGLFGCIVHLVHIIFPHLPGSGEGQMSLEFTLW